MKIKNAKLFLKMPAGFFKYPHIDYYLNNYVVISILINDNFNY